MHRLTDIPKHIEDNKPFADKSLQEATSFQSLCDVHIAGKNFKSKFEKLDSIKNKEDAKLLDEIASPQTPGLFQKFSKQFTKIFRADGFYFRYNFDDKYESLEQEANDYIDSWWNGKSLFDWMRKSWFKLHDERPNDILLIELGEVESDLPDPKVTVIPIESVYDIRQTHNRIDWFIYLYKENKEEETKIYRYIDSDIDVLLFQDSGGNVSNLTDEDGNVQLIENRLGYVPAIRVAQISKSITDDVFVVNQYYHGLLQANKYQGKCNDHDLSAKKHAYPLFYAYQVNCKKCNGGGVSHVDIDEKTGDRTNVKCNSCGGTGRTKFSVQNAGEGLSIPMPKGAGKEDSIVNAPVPAGYVGRDNDTIRLQVELKKETKDEIEEAVLGVLGLVDREAQGGTATEALIDYQPILDRFWAFSDLAQAVHKFLADTILRLRYNTTLVEQTGEVITYVERFKDSSIKYGKKFILKSEQTYRAEIKEAKEVGEPDTVIKDLMREVIIAKYEHDSHQRARQLILLDVMPFPTYTAKELSELGKDVGYKLAFNDVVEVYENDKGMINASTDVKQLDKDLRAIYKQINDE